jgi:catechol 2,3-dioxygenase-like lactoylglutathione lyase family enzyme
MSPLIRGARVLETCLYAGNLEEAGRFYQDVLGLEPFSSADDRHIFFRAGAGVFLLFNPSRTGEGGGAVPPHGSIGPGHVAFAIDADQLGEMSVVLATARIPIEADVAWPGGGRSIYLRDPAGNSVELTTPSIWGLPDD